MVHAYGAWAGQVILISSLNSTSSLQVSRSIEFQFLIQGHLRTANVIDICNKFMNQMHQF